MEGVENFSHAALLLGRQLSVVEEELHQSLLGGTVNAALGKDAIDKGLEVVS